MLAVFTCAVKKQQQNHVLEPSCWVTSCQAWTFKRICTLQRLKWSALVASVLQLPWGCPEGSTGEKSQEMRVCRSLCAHRDGEIPQAVPNCATEAARTHHLLPWAFRKCQEWRQLGFNLSILLVLQESCMIFPEEHLKNWTEIHSHSSWFWVQLDVSSFHISCPISANWESILQLLQWFLDLSQLQKEKRRPFDPHIIPSRRQFTWKLWKSLFHSLLIVSRDLHS